MDIFELFKDKAPFVKGDLIIPTTDIYDETTGETVRDVLGGRVVVCSMTPKCKFNLENGIKCVDWYWEDPIDIIPIHFYRKVTKAEIENELNELDKDIKNIEARKEILKSALQK